MIVVASVIAFIVMFALFAAIVAFEDVLMSFAGKLICATADKLKDSKALKGLEVPVVLFLAVIAGFTIIAVEDALLALLS